MPQAHFLSDGRLHLHHGPIDLILDGWGQHRQQAFEQAQARFRTILQELVDELPLLRQQVGGRKPEGPVARKMAAAAARHNNVFVTPMAAVAGAVADEICRAMCSGTALRKAYVNNGGDIAVFLDKGQSLTAAISFETGAGRIQLSSGYSVRGVATSGWRGRSQSLGIADAVTVLARTAAMADVAATLIANAVNLPDHPAVRRMPANLLFPDSDLGDQPVTTDVGPLRRSEIRRALEQGYACAQQMLRQEKIYAAALFLQGQTLIAGDMPIAQTGEQNARFQIA